MDASSMLMSAELEGDGSTGTKPQIESSDRSRGEGGKELCGGMTDNSCLCWEINQNKLIPGLITFLEHVEHYLMPLRWKHTNLSPT